MEDFKVGDRIAVYEILNDGNYPKGMFTAGTWRMGEPNELEIGRLRRIRSDRDVLSPQFLSMWTNGDMPLNARKVGVMVVKKLKNRDNEKSE